MKQFELNILQHTFKRCYGLSYCIVNNIRGWERELANQSGLRLYFIEVNTDEIVRFAKVRTEILFINHLTD